eukprot:COSAG05_NODE_381_length_10519_cov_17.942131_4_plen_66_part_00
MSELTAFYHAIPVPVRNSIGKADVNLEQVYDVGKMGLSAQRSPIDVPHHQQQLAMELPQNGVKLL